MKNLLTVSMLVLVSIILGSTPLLAQELEHEAVAYAKVSEKQTKAEVESTANPAAINRQPEFPGGKIAWQEFMSEQVRYPDLAKKNGLEGTVNVTVLVRADGSLKIAETQGEAHPILHRAARRTVKAMPIWEPALQHGQPVDFKLVLPVRFSIQ